MEFDEIPSFIIQKYVVNLVPYGANNYKSLDRHRLRAIVDDALHHGEDASLGRHVGLAGLSGERVDRAQAGPGRQPREAAAPLAAEVERLVGSGQHPEDRYGGSEQRAQGDQGPAAPGVAAALDGRAADGGSPAFRAGS